MADPKPIKTKKWIDDAKARGEAIMAEAAANEAKRKLILHRKKATRVTWQT